MMMMGLTLDGSLIYEERSELEDRMSTSSNENYNKSSSNDVDEPSQDRQNGMISSISMSSTMFQNLGLNFREEGTHFFDLEYEDEDKNRDEENDLVNTVSAKMTTNLPRRAASATIATINHGTSGGISHKNKGSTHYHSTPASNLAVNKMHPLATPVVAPTVAAVGSPETSRHRRRHHQRDPHEGSTSPADWIRPKSPYNTSSINTPTRRQYPPAATAAPPVVVSPAAAAAAVTVSPLQVSSSSSSHHQRAPHEGSITSGDFIRPKSPYNTSSINSPTRRQYPPITAAPPVVVSPAGAAAVTLNPPQASSSSSSSHHRRQQQQQQRGRDSQHGRSLDHFFRPSDETLLCWRVDPSISLSDWTLQIFNRSTRSFTVYHVHTVVLGVGPRACGFFQDIFRDAQNHQQQQQQQQLGSRTNNSSTTGMKLPTRTTRVPLVAEACQLIPQFLDYMYGKDEQITLSHENAMGLLHIAEYFRNHSLYTLTSTFVEQELQQHQQQASSPTTEQQHQLNLHRYYSDAVYYDQHDFLLIILRACGRQLLSLERDVAGRNSSYYTHVLDDLSPTHFASMLSDMTMNDDDGDGDAGVGGAAGPSSNEYDADEMKESYVHMTRLVAKYCSQRYEDLPIEMFEQLIRKLKVLDSNTALILLEVSLQYDLERYKGTQQGMVSHSSSEDDLVSSIVFFQRECVGTLSEEWVDLLHADQNRVRRVMEALSKRGEETQNVLVDWFLKTLIRASEASMTTQASRDVTEKRHARMKEELKVTTTELHRSQSELEALRVNYAVTKSEMKGQIAGWVKKNEENTSKRMEEEQKWKRERERWEMNKRQWEYERAEMDRQMHALRDELHSIKFSHRSVESPINRYEMPRSISHRSVESSINRYEMPSSISHRSVESPINRYEMPSLFIDDSNSIVTDVSSSVPNSLLLNHMTSEDDYQARKEHPQAQYAGFDFNLIRHIDIDGGVQSIFRQL